MSGKLASAYVEIGSKTQGFDDGLARAEKSLMGFVSSSNALLATLGAGLAAGSVSKFLADATKAASDLSETVNKVEVSFGDASGEVLKFADGMADKFGLVKKTTLDAAANLGLIAQGAGLSARDAASLSTQLVKLAADASSFYNVPLDQALEKIRAGLVGEAEPLRTFGVLLSEDAVKAEAYASKIAEVGRELTDQQKVTARAAIIMRELGVVSGDLERTQDGLANQLRKVQGDFENFMAKLGEELVPVVSEMVKLGYDLVDAFEVAFDTTPLDAFKEAVGFVRDELVGLRVMLRGIMLGGDFGRALEEMAGEQIGKAVQKFAGEAVGGKEPRKRAIPPGRAEMGGRKFLFGGQGGGPDPTGFMGLLSPFGLLSPLGQAALRTEPRVYEERSARMDVASFGSDAIMRSLEGSQSPMAKQLESQRRSEEHLKDILDELKRGNAKPPGRGGVFPNRRR